MPRSRRKNPTSGVGAKLFCSKPTQHYSCIACGHVGDFHVVRKHNLVCGACKYDDITPMSMSQFKREPSWRKGPEYKDVSFMAFRGFGSGVVKKSQSGLVSKVEVSGTKANSGVGVGTKGFGVVKKPHSSPEGQLELQRVLDISEGLDTPPWEA